MPSGLIVTPVRPPSAAIARITAAGRKAAPFSVSLANTVGVARRQAGSATPDRSSATASMTGDTVTEAIAVSQLAGLATSQIR
ncbi:MAG: hypothetical protein IPL47_12260 [Phyllobacteriaceae bacterium]|nr:hypothetical protein [Phyllobacteriaceae bacterium]